MAVVGGAPPSVRGVTVIDSVTVRPTTEVDMAVEVFGSGDAVATEVVIVFAAVWILCYFSIVL